MKKTSTCTRRKFLKTGVAAMTAPMILPKSVFGANEKINLAWVGFNSMGWGDLNSCAQGNNVVALADCDQNVLNKGKGTYGGAKCFLDFREMLDKMGSEIDAVGVGTPDHNHFAVAYNAINLGKHVFVEKPLTHSLWECRTLQQLAKTKGVVTQMGNQGHAWEETRLIKEWYQAGLIGEVKEILTWTDRPAVGWGFPPHPGQGLTKYPPAQPVPNNLNWDLWLGPTREEIQYNHNFHPSSWRPWWHFGCGGLGDIGCHTIDAPWWAMDLGQPFEVDVEMKYPANELYTSNGSVVTYKFQAKDGKEPIILKWYEGPTLPEKPEGYDGPIWREGGMIMVGTKGGIAHPNMRPNGVHLYPKEKWQAYRENPDGRVPKTLPRVSGIHRDWLNSIRNNGKACSDFSHAGPLTEIALLGTLAIRTGKGMKWDAKKLKIEGNPEAADLIKVPARKGWRPEDL